MAAIINFDAPVKEFAKAINVKLGVVVNRIALELQTGIIKRTPVKTGRARSGWDITVETPSTRLPGPASPVSSVTGSGLVELAGSDGTKMVYIINNLPYIERLENGYSKQAPSGMVRLTMAETAAKYELLLAGLQDK